MGKGPFIHIQRSRRGGRGRGSCRSLNFNQKLLIILGSFHHRHLPCSPLPSPPPNSILVPPSPILEPCQILYRALHLSVFKITSDTQEHTEGFLTKVTPLPRPVLAMPVSSLMPKFKWQIFTCGNADCTSTIRFAKRHDYFTNPSVEVVTLTCWGIYQYKLYSKIGTRSFL